MSLLKIKKMLNELMFFNDCKIVHTFSASNKPFSVQLRIEHNKKLFQITRMDSQEIELFEDIEVAASVIEKLLK